VRRRLLALAIEMTLLSCASSPQKPDQPAGGAEPVPASAPAAPAADAAAAPAPEAASPRVETSPQPALDSRDQGAFDDAVRHAHDGDCAHAIGLFESVLENKPGLAWAAYNLGICYEQTGQSERAIDAYHRALQAMPGPELIQAASDNLVRVYLRSGHTSAAESALRSLLSSNPKALGLHNGLAETLEAEERYDAAADEAKLVLKGDERNVAAMLRLASIYYHQKRYELSRMITDNAKQIDDSSPIVYNTLAFLDLAEKNQTLAIEDFKRAAELREDLPEVQNNLGALLVASQDYQEAVKHLQLAVRYAPSSASTHVNLGNAYRGNKQNELAQQEYEKALHLEPTLKDAYFDLGILFLDGSIAGVAPVDRLNQAIGYFQQFKQAGGEDLRVDQYIKDAQKAIGQEKRHEELERRNKLRKAADDAKKATDDAKRTADAARKAEQERRTLPPAPSEGSGGGSKLSDPGPSPQPSTVGTGAVDGDKLGGGGK
jgi:tetratricopeptide (TPR) repeat protein